MKHVKHGSSPKQLRIWTKFRVFKRVESEKEANRIFDMKECRRHPRTLTNEHKKESVNFNRILNWL